PFIGAGIPDALATLAEALRAAGYATAATTEGGFVDPTYGFTRGFERYGVTVGAEHPLREHLRFARAVAAGTHHRPFFLFVHTFEIHDYFQTTPEYHDFVDGERDAERVRAGNLIEAVRVGRADPDYVARLYAAGVRRGDEFLEELVNAVRVASGDAPLLVVVTSDHGESFGEKGAWHHGTSMYEEQLRV